MLESILRPWHVVVLFLASRLNQEQQRTIEYLQVENEVLREKFGRKRILLSDDQRRRLAVKGKALGRSALRTLRSDHCHPRHDSALASRIGGEEVGL